MTKYNNQQNTHPEVIGVTVTFNRLELLKRTVGCILENGVSRLIVVNNGSTDGTKEWLAEYASKDHRVTVVNQENVGGAGGFAKGISEAVKYKLEWVWCMDDDVFPRPECLTALLENAKPDTGILSPRRLMDGKVFTTEFLDFDFSHPFSSTYKGKLKKLEVNDTTEISGAAFEGLCIRREAIEKAGLPNKDLFIFCDDTDYCYRIKQAGYKILYVPQALMDKHRFFNSDNWTERSRKKKWKRFYQIRNSSYLNHKYGENPAVRTLRGFNTVIGYILTAAVTAPFSKAYSFSDIPKFWKAYRDGIKHKLGIIRQ